MFGCSQCKFAVQKGNVEASNPRMVETKRKAKWPPQGQTVERGCVPEWSPREMKHGHYSTVLKDTVTCKPEEGDLAILKSTTAISPRTLRGRCSTLRENSPWKGSANLQRTHFETIQPRLGASSPTEKDRPTHTKPSQCWNLCVEASSAML